MPQEKFQLHIPTSRLLTGVLLTVVPICAVGLYTLTRAEQAIDRKIGNHFQVIAEFTASEITAYLNERVLAVGTLAANPALIETAQEANRFYAAAGEQAITDRVTRLEKEWNTPASEAAVRDLLQNRASRLLAKWRDRDRRVLRLTLTDSHGAVIAATHKTLDYYQADEDYWQGIYAQGRGAVSITEVLYDDVTKSYYLGLGAPVMDETSNTFVGALDALIEVSSIFPLLHRLDIGPTSRALLVKEDGTVIHAPGVNLSMNVKSDELRAVSEAMGSGPRRASGYAVTTMPGGDAVLIGYAGLGLRESFPKLAWTVLIAQDTREAFAATRGVMRLILIVILVGLAAVTLLAVYASLHRRRDYTDIAAGASEERPAAGTMA